MTKLTPTGLKVPYFERCDCPAPLLQVEEVREGAMLNKIRDGFGLLLVVFCLNLAGEETKQGRLKQNWVDSKHTQWVKLLADLWQERKGSLTGPTYRAAYDLMQTTKNPPLAYLIQMAFQQGTSPVVRTSLLQLVGDRVNNTAYFIREVDPTSDGFSPNTVRSTLSALEKINPVDPKVAHSLVKIKKELGEMIVDSKENKLREIKKEFDETGDSKKEKKLRELKKEFGEIGDSKETKWSRLLADIRRDRKKRGLGAYLPLYRSLQTTQPTPLASLIQIALDKETSSSVRSTLLSLVLDKLKNQANVKFVDHNTELSNQAVYKAIHGVSSSERRASYLLSQIKELVAGTEEKRWASILAKANPNHLPTTLSNQTRLTLTLHNIKLSQLDDLTFTSKKEAYVTPVIIEGSNNDRCKVKLELEDTPVVAEDRKKPLTVTYHMGDLNKALKSALKKADCSPNTGFRLCLSLRRSVNGSDTNIGTRSCIKLHSLRRGSSIVTLGNGEGRSLDVHVSSTYPSSFTKPSTAAPTSRRKSRTH